MNKITYDFRAFNKIKYKKKYLIKFDNNLSVFNLKRNKNVSCIAPKGKFINFLYKIKFYFIMFHKSIFLLFSSFNYGFYIILQSSIKIFLLGTPLFSPAV